MAAGSGCCGPTPHAPPQRSLTPPRSQVPPMPPKRQPPPPMPYGYEIERSYQAQPGCLSGCAVAVLRVHRLAWRRRATLKPFELALGVLVVTVAARTATGYRLAWQPFVLLGGTALGAAAGLWFFGHRVRLDRRVERAYAAAVAIACGIWAVSACYRGPLYPPMLLALLAGTVDRKSTRLNSSHITIS